jgi:hypothetical protein
MVGETLAKSAETGAKAPVPGDTSAPIVPPGGRRKQGGNMHWLNANAGAVTAMMSVILVIVTTVYVILTRQLVLTNRDIVDRSSRPEIAVTLSPDPMHWPIFDLVIQNVGRGPAREIKLGTSSDLKVLNQHPIMEAGPFRTGVPLLVPNEAWRFPLVLARGSWADLAATPLVIQASWSDNEARRYERTFVLDFGQFEHFHVLGQPPLKTLADAVEKIQREIENLARGRSRPEIVCYQPEDAVAEERVRSLFAIMSGLTPEEFDPLLDLIMEKAASARTRAMAKSDPACEASTVDQDRQGDAIPE